MSAITIREIGVSVDLDADGLPGGEEVRFVVIRDGRRVDSFMTREAAERRAAELANADDQPRLL